MTRESTSPLRTLFTMIRRQMPLALVLTGLLMACDHVHAAPVDHITSWTTGTSGPSRFTSGTDRLLIFMAGLESGSNVTINSVTYGGRTMTQEVTAVAGTSVYDRVYIFYLLDSDISLATSSTFSVSYSGTPAEVRYAARMYQNVDQDIPIRDSDSATTDSSTPNPINTSPIIALDDDMVVAAVICGNAETYSWKNGYSEGTNQAGSTSQFSSAQDDITSDGSTIASAENSNPNRQAIVAATIKSNSPNNPKIYYVRPDGNDGNTGLGPTAAEAWRTVREATRADVLAPGDTIYVMAGTYIERLQPDEDGINGLPIRVIGDKYGTVSGWSAGNVNLVTDGEKVIELDNDNYYTFEDFRIQGNPGRESVKIRNSSGIEFTRCEIFDGNVGVRIEGNVGAAITNCLIYDHASDGIYVKDSGCTAVILNTTIADNGGDGVLQDNGLIYLYNSIIAYNAFDGLDRNNGTFYHGYNLVFGNGDQQFEGTGSSTGEISQNPDFVDAANEDYRLNRNSPALNAGTDLAAYVEGDFLAIDRPIGAGWDMGCYEFPLLGDWQFNDGSGLTATDSSGGGKHATLQGGEWEAARCGYAIKLNGSTDWIDLGQFELGTKAYTVSLWFKTTSKAQQTIFAATSLSSSTDHVMFLELDEDGHVQFVNRSPAAASGGTTLASTETYRDGVWHHVAAIKSRTELLLYVDGELVDQASDTTEVPSSVDIAMGRYGVSLSQQYFKGSLDEVLLYAAALSAEEIADSLGLVARWRLDETSGTIAYDSSPLGNHGTYVNDVSLGSEGPKSTVVAADFDGFNDYVQLPTLSDDFSQGLTISVWAQPTASNNWARFIDLGRGEDLDNLLFSRYASSSTLSFTIHDGSLGMKRLNQDNGIVNNAWHHYAATVDEIGLARLYINGVEVASGTIGTPSNVVRNSNFIAHSNWNADGYYQGRMYDMRLYNRELCADDIDNIYQGGKARGVRVIKWIEVK